MLTNLHARLKRASRLLPVALLPFAAHAQFSYTPASSVNTAGTYTDLGTTGTAIATANTDDANSTAQAIGFIFNYNGAAFTQFVLNTNGFIRLGAAAPSSASLFFQESATPTISDPISSTDAADVNIVSPFNMDLAAGTAAGGTEYRLSTTGTAPNRVCTIQWKNVSDKTVIYDLQYSSISFQVKLYETTNNIEFVYNTATQGSNPDDYRFAIVGIKGNSATSGQDVLVNKSGTGSTLWSAATFLTGFYTNTTGAFNYSGNVRPDAGRTYRFVPNTVYANDLSVQSIYTLGSVSSFASPVAVSAVIKNVGSAASTARNATLTVSGATTYTTTQAIPVIAAGASTTITFTAYPVSVATGTNTVTVSLPADDAAANNTASQQQTLTSSTLSYIIGTTYSGGAGIAVAGGTVAVGYRTTGAAAISTVTTSFSGVTTATATYQVIIYSAVAATGLPGTVLYTSPVRPRPAGAAGTITTDVVSVPNIAVNGAFFVGLKTIGADNLSIAYQTETPLRSGTFLYTTTGTTWTDINTSTLNSRLGVDVGLSVVTATRNEALAATVSLYPNPAHNSFQLAVPAGSLHNASAQLINALGQVVQTRQLNLPVAGGTADFNVSSLAAGVYSLQLKSGNDLVVKRVVVE